MEVVIRLARFKRKFAKLIRCTQAFPLYKLQRASGANLQTLPVSLTLSLSYKCNSRCQTCFIWQREPEKELSLSEWEKVLASIGSFPLWVTIGGGEPFLNPDLTHLVRLIARLNQPLIVNIPTNALLPEEIVLKTRGILEENKEVTFIINLSLDNLEEKHDKIRGVAGNFEKFKACYGLLRGLKKKYRNLFLGINTTISRFNIADCAGIFKFVHGLAPDSYITEIADERRELNNFGKGLRPETEDYLKAVELLRKLLRNKNNLSLPGLIRNLRLAYYKFSGLSLSCGKELLACYAGIASVFIDPSGKIWPCCRMMPFSLGDLKDFEYDFPAAWNNATALQARRQIKQAGCRCVTANNFYTNLMLNPFQGLRRLR